MYKNNYFQPINDRKSIELKLPDNWSDNKYNEMNLLLNNLGIFSEKKYSIFHKQSKVYKVKSDLIFPLKKALNEISDNSLNIQKNILTLNKSQNKIKKSNLLNSNHIEIFNENEEIKPIKRKGDNISINPKKIINIETYSDYILNKLGLYINKIDLLNRFDEIHNKISKQKLKDLKEMCKRDGLNISGRKSELIYRIESHIKLTIENENKRNEDSSSEESNFYYNNSISFEKSINGSSDNSINNSLLSLKEDNNKEILNDNRLSDSFINDNYRDSFDKLVLKDNILNNKTKIFERKRMSILLSPTRNSFRNSDNNFNRLKRISFSVNKYIKINIRFNNMINETYINELSDVSESKSAISFSDSFHTNRSSSISNNSILDDITNEIYVYNILLQLSPLILSDVIKFLPINDIINNTCYVNKQWNRISNKTFSWIAGTNIINNESSISFIFRITVYINKL